MVTLSDVDYESAGSLGDKVIISPDATEKVVKENRNKIGKKVVKIGLAALLSAGIISGTFNSIETKTLEEYTKNGELVTVAYNRKGSSAGILVGGMNEVYGKVYGLELNGISQSPNSSTIGVKISLADTTNGKLTGLVLSLLSGSNTKNIFEELKNGEVIKEIHNGAQISLVVNAASKLKNAVQIGAVNLAKDTEGFYLQIGGYNRTDKRATIGINFGYKK